MQEGKAALLGLLKMADASVEALKPSEAAAHADLLWNFILQVLDLRRAPPPTLAAFQPAESAAVQLLVKLTLKLSETQFKPRFLRFLDWAAALPSAGNAPGLCHQGSISN